MSLATKSSKTPISNSTMRQIPIFSHHQEDKVPSTFMRAFMGEGIPIMHHQLTVLVQALIALFPTLYPQIVLIVPQFPARGYLHRKTRVDHPSPPSWWQRQLHSLEFHPP